MSGPRKFVDKIALLHQKQAEGDVAFRTILCEVGEAKQRVNHIPAANCKLDVPKNVYGKPYEKYQGANLLSNVLNNADSNRTNNCVPQMMKMDNGNECDQLLQLPDNPSWRRTNSDPSLHHHIMSSVVGNYPDRVDAGNNNQLTNYGMINVTFESAAQGNHPQHLQMVSSSFQTHHSFDSNNDMNQSYINDRSHSIYPNTPITGTVSLPTNSPAPPSITHTHPILGPRYSGGSTGSNVLMLPPPHHSRGGSLPDLRTGNGFQPQHVSFSTSPPTQINQNFRSVSPQDSGDTDLYLISPQQHFTSSIGPLKQSPSSRRRPSPLGEVKQSSPRRQNESSPDVSPNSATLYRVEPSSPQSQSSYSSQNSPHLLASPGNDHSPFSPQQSGENNGNNQQAYYALPTPLEQITLDHNFYTQQQVSSNSTSTAQQPNHHHQHHHSSSPTSTLNSLSNDINDIHLNYFRPTNFYPLFIDNVLYIFI